jgi:hypothetical protein
MSKLPSNDQQLQVFLRKYRPEPPPPLPDLEEQLMLAISCTSKTTAHNQVNLSLTKTPKKIWCTLWLIPSTIAVGLLISWSSIQLLIPSPELANANLESFIETNWNDVTGDPPANPMNNLQTDWMLQTNSIH